MVIAMSNVYFELCHYSSSSSPGAHVLSHQGLPYLHLADFIWDDPDFVRGVLHRPDPLRFVP
jgi:hypothetical protein